MTASAVFFVISLLCIAVHFIVKDPAGEDKKDLVETRGIIDEVHTESDGETYYTVSYLRDGELASGRTGAYYTSDKALRVGETVSVCYAEGEKDDRIYVEDDRVLKTGHAGYNAVREISGTAAICCIVLTTFFFLQNML